jgi:hypothetical protein
MEHLHRDYWRASATVRELGEDEPWQEANFVTRAQAELAAAWALEVRLAELMRRAAEPNALVSEIRVERVTDQEHKIVWWKKHPGGGFSAHKDYFGIQEMQLDLTLLD